MSKPKKAKRNGQPTLPAATSRRFPRLGAVVMAVAVLSAGGFWWSKGRRADLPPGVVNATNARARAASPSPGYEKLQGKWMRPDGGYILEIRSATVDGKLDAGYFNPRSIHVARAQWLQKDGKLQMFVELRDVNYPGSTYTLAYEPGSDQLAGIYFQAATQQQFEVFFERVK